MSSYWVYWSATWIAGARRNPAAWSGKRFSRRLVHRDRIDLLPWLKSSIWTLGTIRSSAEMVIAFLLWQVVPDSL